ncbi:major facilitator superfamily protein [Citrobacter freundii]|nr:major facilitator superfamily protein [Citrobacter freundii]
MVHSFTQFVLVRIGMGIGEAPMNPCGVKVINDWFNIKERGRARWDYSTPLPPSVLPLARRFWLP